jgi:hypothetical protein
MKALTFNGKVVQVELVEFEVSPLMKWVDCPDDCVAGWEYINGEVVRPQPPVKTLPEIVAEFSAGLQEFIDSVAAQKQYGSALYCASYGNSTNQQWKAEAETFIAWRDGVWVYCYTELAKFESGERAAVSFDEFKTELPAIAWP